MCDDNGEKSSIMDQDEIDDENCLVLSHEEKDIILEQQGQEIEELKKTLKDLSSERDTLLCEVSRLKFELEMSDLKRLNDER